MNKQSDTLEETSSIERIVAAAQESFATYGYEAVKVQQIADKADVSAKLIYHYFGRKENLYLETLYHMAKSFFERFDQGAADHEDPIRAIHDFAWRFTDFYLTHPHTGRLILDQVLHAGQQITRSRALEQRRDEMLEPLRAAITAGVAQGKVRPDLSAEGLFYHALVVVLGYGTVTSLLGPLHLDVPELSGKPEIRQIVADCVVAFSRPAPPQASLPAG